jgi:peptidoglycan/LPS O-acetylase OafA/YrhL
MARHDDGANPAPRFVILDGLRLVFALMVVVSHIAGPIRIERTYLAVDFFFILSGFVLAWSYCGRVHEPDILRTFVIDRVARLYPLHLATFFLLVIIQLWSWAATGNGTHPGYSGFFVGILFNLALLQAVGPAVELVKALGFGQPYTWNGPAWSVSVEFYVNVLLAMVLMAFVALPLRLAAMGIGAIAVASYGLLGTTCLNLSCEDFGSPSVFSPIVQGVGCGFLRGIGAMALGVLCCGVVRRLRNLPKCLTASGPAALFSGVALFGLLFDRPDYGDIAAIAAASVLVCSIALYEHRRPFLSAPRLSEALFIAGSLSYAVYLIHSPLIVLANLFIPGVLDRGVTPTVLITLLVVVLAFPVHYLFELPLKRVTRVRLAKVFVRRRPLAGTA